jgi:DNA-directed RNA polymerase II subunit RPB2
MEKDGIIAHGMSMFLNTSFLERGDLYYMAVCNKTGSIAVYNSSINLFLSPFSDGPLHFDKDVNDNFRLKTISRYGRSFSILKIPYSLKLIIQESQAMNVQMRIITDSNVNKLLSMSYSDNINTLLKVDEPLETLIPKYKINTEIKLHLENDNIIRANRKLKIPIIEEEEDEEEIKLIPSTPPYAPSSPDYAPE